MESGSGMQGRVESRQSPNDDFTRLQPRPTRGADTYGLCLARFKRLKSGTRPAFEPSLGLRHRWTRYRGKFLANFNAMCHSGPRPRRRCATIHATPQYTHLTITTQNCTLTIQCSRFPTLNFHHSAQRIIRINADTCLPWGIASWNPPNVRVGCHVPQL